MNQMMMRSLLCVALVPAAGCLADPDEPELGDEESDLLGTISHTGEPELACPAAFAPLLERAMVWGRAAALTPAFAQCVDQAVRVGGVPAPYPRGPYVPSAGDPLSGATKAEQAARVLQSARSLNDLKYNCFETGDFAGSAIVEEVGTRPEIMTFGLAAVRSWLNPALVLPEQSVTETVWHEAMHQHAYNHDADRPGFSTENQSIPYIVDGCMQTVIAQSAALCGSMTQCGPDAVPIIDSLAATTGQCSCAQDPRGDLALGELTFRPTGLRAAEKVVDQTAAGWWLYKKTDAVAAVGDVDGDGTDDLLLRNADGFGFVSHRFGPQLGLVGSWPWNSWVAPGPGSSAWWFLNPTDTFQPVGDMNGDGRAELLVRSAWGVGILSYTDQLRVLTMRQWGEWIVSWKTTGDEQFLFAKDFDGNGTKDLFVRNSWGIGVWSLRGASLGAIAVGAHATSLGGWWLQPGDRFEGAGDFNGGGAEIIVRSGWGLGLLTVINPGGFGATPGGFATVQSCANGAWMHGWRLAASDTLHGVGDVNGDGRQELVIRSGWGINVVGLNTGGAWQVWTGAAFGDWLGSWRIGSADQVAAFTDLTGDGRDDLLLQSGWGMGVVSQSGWPLVSVATHQHDTFLGGWRLRPTNLVLGTARLDRTPGAEIVIVNR